VNRKLLISVGLLILSLIGELFLWDNVILLSSLLVLMAYVKHKLYPINKEILWYLLICINGAIAEIILVNFGQGWRYTHPDLFGIPLWIPLFWGFVGTTIIVIYESITKKN